MTHVDEDDAWPQCLLCTLLGFLSRFISLFLICNLGCTKRNKAPESSTSKPVNTSKVSVSTVTSHSSLNSCGDSHVLESRNLVIAVQLLRKATNGFSPENELGRGGFGTVYKGKLEDETKIAVKRMGGGSVEEFNSELSVLSHVRHPNVVSLLGYSNEGAERLLAYEYIPQGELGRHLFHWKKQKLESLPWMTRLNIALDIARGIKHLHSCGFIHRDIKSSNILLNDDFLAKISDFGLVKWVPDGKDFVATTLAGTFGYLAPEYAVTWRISKKADIFGVMLMELITGRMTLDEEQPEETRYLLKWFRKIKSRKMELIAAIDTALLGEEDIFFKISVDHFLTISEVAILARRCAAREPSHRPYMDRIVNVLSFLVERWERINDDIDRLPEIDYSLSLPQMLKA